MVKEPKKSLGITNTSQISPNQTLKLDSKLSKSRQQINQEYYQRNKEKRNTREKERYYRKKEQTKQQAQKQSSKYYGVEAIKILMSLKEYTELNQEKRKF